MRKLVITKKPIVGICTDCKKPIYWVTNRNGVMTGYSKLPSKIRGRKKEGVLHPCQARRKMEGKKWLPKKRK